MKKQVKIITTILMIVMVLTTLASGVLASEREMLDRIKDGNGMAAPTSVENFGKAIVSVVRVVGVIVAVVVLLVLGVKYMIGSAEERAEYKKTMVPYIVGAVLIFASTTLVGMVYDLANSLTK